MTERVTPIDVGIVPESAVSGAVLLQSEYSAYLIFNAVTRSEFKDAGHAICEFTRCIVTKFGHPNDEAAWGIPRMKGAVYEVCEVFNSDWAREVTLLNRYSFPNTPDPKERHFLVSFHDSTFECLASDISIQLSDEPFEEILARLSKLIAAE